MCLEIVKDLRLTKETIRLEKRMHVGTLYNCRVVDLMIRSEVGIRWVLPGSQRLWTSRGLLDGY